MECVSYLHVFADDDLTVLLIPHSDLRGKKNGNNSLYIYYSNISVDQKFGLHMVWTYFMVYMIYTGFEHKFPQFTVSFLYSGSHLNTNTLQLL